jgi:hypothetical protein
MISESCDSQKQLGQRVQLGHAFASNAKEKHSL